MTDAEKIAFCQSLINDVSVTTDQISTYLQVASARILQRLYPFGVPYTATLPVEYYIMQCELAVRMIARRGGEGEVQHNESGVNRVYGTVNDEDILQRVVPYAKVM